MAPTASLSQPVDLVLHIGTGKTGTSSIQDLMHRNRALLAEHGLLYPISAGRRRHTRFGLFIRPDRELDAQGAWHELKQPSPAVFRRKFERQLLTELDDAHLQRMLISDEAMYGASNEALQRLRALTDRIARTVRVVVYLRRQDDHLCSRYQQVVKVGEVRRFADRIQQLNLSSTYDYRARLATWQRLVDPTEFVVRRFEPQSFVDGSLYQDFLDAVGVGMDAAQLETVERSNESLDAESVEFLRIWNLHRVQTEGARPGVMNNRKLVARLTAAATGPTLTLPDETLDAFMANWEESNRAVVRDFLGEADGQLFRSPRKSRGTTTEQRLDPARVDHFIELLELPEETRIPLRGIAEREAATTA